MRSVLVNLVQNAIEAVAWSERGTAREVLVSVEPPKPGGPQFVAIGVEDSGPGIAPDARVHLFEPLFTTKRTGTGLGLATAQRFTTAHGGRIELAESQLGGARFVVRLPARPVRRLVEVA
jgi:C4-dicarboxylate-specific signal transduction histidine kinase